MISKNNKIMNNIYYSFLSIAATIFIFSFLSCEDMLDLEQKGVLSYEDNYQTDFDSRSAAMGIAGMFQQTVADQYVLLGELRSDLLDVTTNGDAYMRELSSHHVTDENPYADARSFYNVILSCNDAMHNIEKMYESELLSDWTFARDYSEIACFRIWMYYLLAIHYGEVPYITVPIEDVDMLDYNDYPMLGINDMMDTLIVEMENLPYPGDVDWNVSLDDYVGINRAFVDKKMLIGDLYLWKASLNNDLFYYIKAAEAFKLIMDRNDASGKFRFKTSYHFGYGANEQDETYSWNDMFKTYVGGTPMGSLLYHEWRWFCIIDQRFDQYTGFVDYFSYQYGSYKLKPSDYVIDLWQQDTTINGEPDPRGENASWGYEAGLPAVKKYSYGVEDGFTNDADLYVYRTGTLYLRYAEIVNRLGECDLALAVLNPNISLAIDPRATYVEGTTVNELFDFSDLKIRTTTTAAHAYDRGVRGRVSMAPLVIENATSREDSIRIIEDLISLEYAKEVAFEGERWQNLLRFAHRKEFLGEGGSTFLGNAVAAKFDANGDGSTAAEIRNKFMDVENWYLPLY